jgi:ankyrin repeat protein
MDACLNGHKEVVELLLVKGADVNIKAIERKTALMIASQKATKR